MVVHGLRGRARAWRSARSALSLLAAAVLLAVTAGCKRPASYPQDTPDATVKSAVAMVQNGDAGKLGDLVYSDSPEMRAVLTRLGTMLGHMQELAAAVQKKFPADVAKLRDEAKAAAADGRGASLLSAFSAGGPGGGGGGGRGQRGAARGSGGRVEVRLGSGAGEGSSVEVSPGGGGGGGGDEGRGMERLMMSLFADPYGWVEENAPRLAAQKLVDDLANVTLDGEPVIWATLKKEKEKWFFTLPLNMPVVSGYMPRSRAEWSIIASTIKVLDNTVMELTGDVKSGKVGSLALIGEKAQQKAIFPAMIAFSAYGHEMDIRGKRDRAAAQFKKKKREWAKGREAGAGEASAPLLAAIDQVSSAEIDKIVRGRTKEKFEGMTDDRFSELVGGWLSAAGLPVPLTGPLSGDEVDAKVTAWAAKRKGAEGKKK